MKTQNKVTGKKARSELKLPGQFKPDRAINDGPWSTYITRSIARHPTLTMDDLLPTNEDLQLISQLAFSRDELADNLATLIFEDRKVAQQFEIGISQGIAALDNPPQALIDFLDYYENMPDWTYMPELQKRMATKKGQAFLNARRSSKQKNPLLQALEDSGRLTAGFFIGAYYPAVGQSIVSTGSVANGSARVIQTFKFFDDTSDVRDFMPLGKAVQAGAKVRLAHAFARKQIEKAGTWDKEYYGEIISDFDNMIFASGIILGVNAIQAPEFKEYGVDPGKAVTYFLGAPKELLQLEPQQIYRFFLMCVAHLDGSPETAKQVYASFRNNEHYKSDRTLEDKFYKEVTYLTANLMTRIVWGNRIADEIEMEKSFYGLPLDSLADSIAEKINQEPSQASTLILKTVRKLIVPLRKLSRIRLPSRPKLIKSKKSKAPEPYSGSFGVFGKAENH